MLRGPCDPAVEHRKRLPLVPGEVPSGVLAHRNRRHPLGELEDGPRHGGQNRHRHTGDRADRLGGGVARTTEMSEELIPFPAVDAQFGEEGREDRGRHEQRLERHREDE
ncbi:Uncharacterised protein [Mycobacteroides abscessus subsp. abscessus]|nr:Uncharacterised protein [Mycobacteroides abscessus subsp. abscessus]